MIKNQREAIATHLGLDYSEVEWYQDRGSRLKVYATDGFYYFAVKVNVVKPKFPEDFGKWERKADSYLEGQGWAIYIAIV